MLHNFSSRILVSIGLGVWTAGLASGVGLSAASGYEARADIIQVSGGPVAATRDSGPDIRSFKAIPFADAGPPNSRNNLKLTGCQILAVPSSPAATSSSVTANSTAPPRSQGNTMTLLNELRFQSRSQTVTHPLSVAVTSRLPSG